MKQTRHRGAPLATTRHPCLSGRCVAIVCLGAALQACGGGGDSPGSADPSSQGAARDLPAPAAADAAEDARALAVARLLAGG